MVTDLSAVNKVIHSMHSLQSGIPVPCLLPKECYLIDINLKVCFFTILLQEKDIEKFTFTVPTYNYQPDKRYQWQFLPQGMLNRPTLYKYFICQSLEMAHSNFLNLYFLIT